jgi:UDP-N-acetylmuramate dehydrogenase
VTAARRTDAPLRELNTFGVRALARELWTLEDRTDLPGLLAALRTAGTDDPLMLGGGSNLLITGDLDIPVIAVRLRGRSLVAEAGDSVTLEAAAGESWDGLVRWSLAAGLCGLENLALIPGSVGAAPIQNIGAYGAELRECFESLEAVHLGHGGARRFDAAECAFGYRDSTFRHGDGARWLITSVRLRLSRRPALKLDYGEIREQLRHDRVSAPRCVDVADAVTAIRRRRLPDPALLGNAGSFFRNPVVGASIADALSSREPGLPRWPAGDRVKLSAAWMIERCGWKGRRDGDAGVHASHALVLVNHGEASGEDLLRLARAIRDSVHARFGVRLDAEPVIVGPGRL